MARLEEWTLCGKADPPGKGVRARRGLQEAPHSWYQPPGVLHAQPLKSFGYPAIGVPWGFADDKEPADPKEGSSAFRHSGRGTEGARGDRVDRPPPLRRATRFLGPGQFGHHPALPLHGHNRFVEKGHPALEGIEKHHLQIRPGFGNNQTGDPST